MELYKELIWGMSAFGGPTLWSSLDRREIDLDPIGRPSDDEIFNPSNYAPLTDIVFSKLHPAHLVVRLPDQSILMETHGQAPDWASCLRRLQGHHIEVIDYSPIVTSDLPRASSLLTVRYKVWEDDPTGLTGPIADELNDRIFQKLTEPFMTNVAFDLVDQVKLVGVLRQGPDDEDDDISESEAFEILDRHFPHTMRHRSGYGKGDMQVAILRDTSPESEAGAVWRTYRQPR